MFASKGTLAFWMWVAGGRTVAKLAAMTSDGVVYGVDYSEGSVAASLTQNENSVKAGRVFIKKAAVSNLPFPDDTFDLVTEVETHYYWPDLANDMKEIQRVLKPGGKLVIIAEMYKGGKYDHLKWPAMWLLRSAHLSAKQAEAESQFVSVRRRVADALAGITQYRPD